MPSESGAQQRFMAMDLRRKREGKATKTHMSEQQLEDFARTKRKGLPKHVHHGHHGKRDARYS